MKGQLLARIALVLIPSIMLLLVMEVGLRVSVPRYLLLDQHTDLYWKLRFQDSVARHRADPETPFSIASDPELGWRMNPLFEADGVSHTSTGLRGQRTDFESVDPQAERIVALGDSFTYGLGVSDEETYAARLDRLLPDYDVANLGVNGFGTDQQYLMWLEEGVSLRPRFVLLGYYIPDFHRNALGFREFAKPRFELEGEGLRLVGVPVPSLEALLADPPRAASPPLRIVEALSGTWVRALRRLQFSGSDDFVNKAGLTRQIIAALDRSTEEHDAQLAIVVIPHLEYRDYPQSEAIRQVILEVAEQRQIPVLDLTDALEAVDGKDAPLYAANGHWTALGHERVAQHIIGLLREMGAATPAER